MPDSVAVVVDPHAGGGRTRSIWPLYEKAIRRRFGKVTVDVIGHSGGVGDSVVAAAGLDHDLVIIVGDTGSANEAAEALLASGWTIAELPTIALLPVGAGADFTRSLGYSGSADAVVDAIADGHDAVIDVIRVTFVDDSGAPRVRHMVNTAGMGLSSRIARKANAARLNRMLSSHLVFFPKTIRALIAFRFPRVRVTVNGHEPIGTKIAEIVIANGRFYGGGMAIAPDAELDDGEFDLVVIRAQSKWRLIDQINRIYKGHHRNAPFVDILKGTHARVEPVGAGETLGLVLDGIPVGGAPMQAEILKAAFKIRAAARIV
ncbi:MAG: hypothetical protein IPL47_09445 [Phyllobacteriaceae bacterium]|nr:hypothetical protein [Phyllobacteriaceae bacterium]